MNSKTKNLYKKVCDVTKLEHEKAIENFLVICEMDNFAALASLAEKDFLKESVDYYENKTPDKISPGLRLRICTLGTIVSQMSKAEFDRKCEADIEKNEFPLLELLNQQSVIGKSKYSPLLKQFGLWLRIKAGRDVYKVVSTALPLPSYSSVQNMIKGHESVQEGVLQVFKLLSCSCKGSRFLYSLTTDPRSKKPY